MLIKNLSQSSLITALWLLLVGLTLFSAFMAEQSDSGFFGVAIMASVLALKGRIIVDHFMELKNSHKGLRFLMRFYFYVIPALIILVYFFPQQIAQWSTLN